MIATRMKGTKRRCWMKQKPEGVEDSVGKEKRREWWSGLKVKVCSKGSKNTIRTRVVVKYSWWTMIIVIVVVTLVLHTHVNGIGDVVVVQFGLWQQHGASSICVLLDCKIIYWLGFFRKRIWCSLRVTAQGAVSLSNGCCLTFSFWNFVYNKIGVFFMARIVFRG